MGISGLYRELGPGQRQSLAKFSSDFYIQHNRCLRLAVDISIWLFQIQASKGGTNPALRTFYYRLLRLLTLNIHPLFVFDGPNKPLYKRNKRVGSVQNGNGGYQKVASVPEYLAKQLLKTFGFPWHVAPGEAEAECALLQQEGLVDAVMSEDVDTMMFGCSLTLRNWTPEGSAKSPTHVNVYRAEQLRESSGIGKHGMVLVALMSGGDYLPDGIPGCGIKLACDAARAGFGEELCALRRSDRNGLRLWKERLQHQIRTNEAKYFSRKLKDFTLPDDFPNMEVLGWYARPCISSSERLRQMRDELTWDLDIDFPALREFTKDAFDWRNLGGAKHFIRNFSPAALVKKLRLSGEAENHLNPEMQNNREKRMVIAIHGRRNHASVDGELELRISFIPTNLVPIDLSAEPEGDDFVPAGGDESDAESDCPPPEEPASPRKRNPRPYDAEQPDKLWVLSTFLKLGCPLAVEDYEASMRDPKDFFKQIREARTATKGSKSAHPARARKKNGRMPKNALMQYATITKSTSKAVGADNAKRMDPGENHPRLQDLTGALRELDPTANTRSNCAHFRSSSQPVGDEKPNIRFVEQGADLSLPYGLLVPGSSQNSGSSRQKRLLLPPRVEIIDQILPIPHRPVSTTVYSDIDPSTMATSGVHPNRDHVLLSSMPVCQDPVSFMHTDQSTMRPSTSSGISQQAMGTFKKRVAELSSPVRARKGGAVQQHSSTPQKALYQCEATDIIDLVSPSPRKVSTKENSLASSINEDQAVPHAEAHHNRVRDEMQVGSEQSSKNLPTSVTKRRKGRALRRSLSAPAGVTSTSIGSRSEDGLDDGELELSSERINPIHAETSSCQKVPVHATNHRSPHPGSSLDPAAFPVPLTGMCVARLPAPKPSLRIDFPLSEANRLTEMGSQSKKKEVILLRESLEGAWKAGAAATLSPPNEGRRQRPKGRAKVQEWITNDVEIMDMTQE